MMSAEEQGFDSLRRMRAGIREALLRSSQGLRRMSPGGLLALLAAGAFAPVIAATGGIAGAGLVAVFALIGGVGANVLTDLISSSIDRLRKSDSTREPTQAEVEQELIAQIEAALDADDDRAKILQDELAQVLRKIGMSQAALEAVIESGNQELRLALEEAFVSLSADFAGFGFLLTDVNDTALAIQQTLQRQDTEHQADRQRSRQQSDQLTLLLKELAVIEQRTRYLYGTVVFADSDQKTAKAAEFEERYRKGVRRLLDKVELFGLDLPRVPRSFRLGAAYVSLLLEQTGSRSKSGERLHLEDLLMNHQRILVEGAAGSGKSTVLRRLGIRALDGDLPGGSQGNVSLIPFLLKLRTFVEKDTLRLPSHPDEFIASVAPLLSQEKPENWVSGLLGKGRAVVLIDGIDEIRETHRPDLLSWLQQLTAWFPEAFYIATSRPAAVKEQWRDDLRALGFVTARLEPMDNTQVQEFVGRWYRAAEETGFDRYQYYLSPGEIESRAAGLKAALASRHELQILATTPLLCAVMCAVYFDQNRLPARRTELYEMALALLLERRDTARTLRPTYQLRFRDSKLMLSRIALWMLVTGQDSMPREAALTAIADLAGHLGESPPYIRQQLLEQTGLVQETGKDLIEFRYPTFQDYLAAFEVIRQDLIGYLIINAHIPVYRDVILNVVELADSDTSRRLLTGLIERAEQEAEPSYAQQLWLLGADCLSGAQLGDDLGDRIESALNRIGIRGHAGEA